MTTGWTGGQYSIYRGLLAIGIAIVLATRLTADSTQGVLSALLGVGILGCLALAAGFQDRLAAILLLVLLGFVVAFIDGAPLVVPGADLVVGLVLLALHAATPRAPFGSWQARARPDPGGDWRMPPWIATFAWALLAFVLIVTDLGRITGSAYRPGAINSEDMAAFGMLFDVTFLIALFSVRWRPSAWIAISIWKLAWLSAFGPMPGGSCLWLLHLLTFDPAWLPGRASPPTSSDPRESALLFYDGECGLCHRVVRFILAEDARCGESLQLRFSPIGSDAFAAMIEASSELDTSELPDSIVLELEDGRVLVKSAAALEIASRLGGLWRIIGFIVQLGGVMPIPALDVAYDIVAKYRKRFFAQPKDACPILPPQLRARFEI